MQIASAISDYINDLSGPAKKEIEKLRDEYGSDHKLVWAAILVNPTTFEPILSVQVVNGNQTFKLIRHFLEE